MGGRGNNRNNGNNYYSSLNNGGRNPAYDNRSQPMSQPPHTSRSSSNNYSSGRDNSNYQAPTPCWSYPYPNPAGYPRPPQWPPQHSNVQWSRNNYRPQRPPSSWDQHPQQIRFPNARSWNTGPPAPHFMPGTDSTFRFGQVPLGIPPPPPMIGMASASSEKTQPLLTKSNSGKLTSSVTNPPLGSKEDRELRLEEAKTLVKKSLEKSKCDETSTSNSSSASSSEQVKQKYLKSKHTKPNEGNTKSKQNSSVPVDQVSNQNSNKTSSSASVSTEQHKRRVSLESNCLSSEASKSTTKPTTPKRNRSNSLSSSSIPKTPEISMPSEAQNIKQRIIHELLGMSKNTLKEIISNPRSRKFEHVMKYMMKESRWKQSQIQRQAAQAGIIDSTSEGQNCELLQRDYEDLLSDPDLAINLSNLPSEMIETLGNIFNLGSVSEEPQDSCTNVGSDSDDVACLFDSNSPSYVKQVPFVDLSSPVSTHKVDPKDSPGDQEKLKIVKRLAFEGNTQESSQTDQDLSAHVSSIPFIDPIVTDEAPNERNSPEPSPNVFVSDITTLTSVPISLANSEKLINRNESIRVESSIEEEMCLLLSTPQSDNVSVPVCQDRIDTTEETMPFEMQDSNINLDRNDRPIEEEGIFTPPLTLSSDVVLIATDKDKEQQSTSAVDEASFSSKDPMFSTQSDSPTMEEELSSCCSQTKQDSENNHDTDEGCNNQSAMDEPLMSPDSLNAATINNNDIMTMRSIDTVEPDESVNVFGSGAQPMDKVDSTYSDDCELSSNLQDLDSSSHKRSEITVIMNVCSNEPTTNVTDSTHSTLLQQKDKEEDAEATQNNTVSVETVNQTDSLSVLENTRVEGGSQAEIQEPVISSKALPGIEIGIQTDTSVEEPCSIGANDMDLIIKLLESSSLPGVDRVKKLLYQSSNKLPTDKNSSSSPSQLKCTEKGISVIADSLNFSQSSSSAQSRCPRSRGETTARLIPAAIGALPLVQTNQATTAHSSRSKRHRGPAATDSDAQTSSGGILKDLENQIKGLEPKDKLKHVFLKITDIEKKIAVWADIKKELYQLVSYILEDEKSQSASSSLEDSVLSEVELESSRNSRSSVKNSLSCSSQIRVNKSSSSSVPSVVPICEPVDSDSVCKTTSNPRSKISSKNKRPPEKRKKKTSPTSRKKTNARCQKTTPVSAAVEKEFITPVNVSSRPTRSSEKIKIESSSDNDDTIPIGERSRSSKRNKTQALTFSDSSPSPSPPKKRACKRQSASIVNALITQSDSSSSSPLRKTKAELKQMVFFPKPPETRTRSSSVSKSLNEDSELRLTRRGRSVIIKEEKPDDEPNETEVTSLSCSLPLRDCSVVLEQLDKSSVHTATSSENTHSVSSSEDDEMPLSLLSRKPNLDSPTASLQGDIDISSVSSSDTVSLKLNIACPKSMKNQMKRYGGQGDGPHLHHHHSSKHGPLEFPQHNQGAILDIKVVGKHVLAASEDGVVLSYSVKSGKLKKKYRGHSAAVTCICIINAESEPFYPEKMVTGSIDGQLRCFVLKTGEQIHAPLQVGETSAIVADWGVIYLGTKKGEVAQVSAKTFTRIGEIFECSKEPVHALIATKEGPRKVLIVGSRNQAITVRDAETGLLLRSVSGGWQDTVYSLLLDNSLVYCGTKTGNVPVFHFTNGQQMFRLKAGNGVRCLKAYHGLLFAGCYDGFIYVFKDQTLVTKFAGGKMIISMDFTKNKVIFSSKDKLQALNFPHEVSILLKESRTKKVH